MIQQIPSIHIDTQLVHPSSSPSSLVIPNVVECGMKLVLSPPPLPPTRRLMRWNAMSALRRDIHGQTVVCQYVPKCRNASSRRYKCHHEVDGGCFDRMPGDRKRGAGGDGSDLAADTLTRADYSFFLLASRHIRVETLRAREHEGCATLARFAKRRRPVAFHLRAFETGSHA